MKAWEFTNSKGGKSYGRWCQTYLLIAGRSGLGVSCISYDAAFTVSVTADEAVCKDTTYLTDAIEKNIRDEIERMRDVPVPEAKKAK